MATILVDPRPVAVARMGLGAAVLLNTLEQYFILSGLASGKLTMPFVDWAPGVTSYAASGVLTVGIMAGVALILGVGTRPAGLAYAIMMAFLLLWDQQTYSSHQVLVMLLVAYLAFAESGAAWSVVRHTGPMAQVPWWPQLLMMTQLSVLYLFAGLSKINTQFLSGQPLSDWVRWPLPDWVFAPMSIATVIVEVFVLAVGLWVPATRLVAIAAGICLHLSIVTMLSDQTIQLVAFALACTSIYPLFLARPPLRPGQETAMDPALKQIA